MVTALTILAFFISQLPNIGPLDQSILHSGTAGTDSENGVFKVTTTESVWTVRKLAIAILLSIAVLLAVFGRKHHE